MSESNGRAPGKPTVPPTSGAGTSLGFGPERGAADEILGSSQVRAQHSALLLRLLWRARESSRADLARATGLSRSTISAIVSGLLDSGLINETRPGVSRGGRKPIVLAFDDDAFFLVGVDMGATHISVAVTNLRAEVRAWRTRSHAVRNDPRGAIEAIHELVDEALAAAEGTLDRVLGIGVGAPTPVDPTAPGRFYPLILPKWEGLDLVDELHKVYDLPVFIENDANLGALAEAWWGEGRDARNIAFIKLALGIGAGLIIDGRIHRGRFGTAGEIGHTFLDPKGTEVGLQGYVNTIVGTKRLLSMVKERAPDFPDSALAARKRPSLDHLVDAGIARDPLAESVFEFAGEVLGTAIANMFNLLAPEVVVLGGSLTRAGDALIEPLQRTVRTKSLAKTVQESRIMVSPLSDRGIALGAATLVLEAALDDPRLFARRQVASA